MPRRKNIQLVCCRLISFCLLVLSGLSCAEREKQNPFDPHGRIYLTLTVLSHDQQVELMWDSPNLTGYTGFNIYRKQEGVDTVFKTLASMLLPDRREFTDYHIDYHQRYLYYVTVVGEDMESKPSSTVSILPGPGQVWMVDKWGYQVLLSTYDVEHIIRRYLTNSPPTDMAIAANRNTGLILYNDFGIVEAIDLNSMQSLVRITSIAHPYNVAFDSAAAIFWIVDTTGYLYKVNASSFQVTTVSSALGKPTQVSVSENAGHINVVDQKLKKIFQFDRAGNVISEISSIGDHPLIKPERYLETADTGRFWLVDDAGIWDRIYTRLVTMEDFQCIDSLNAAGDLALATDHTLVWIVNYNNIDSSVMQLSASGTRPLELKGFYNPYDIEINPYDGSLLIADTGNGRVLHYDNTGQLIGKYLNLNFPVKVMVE